MGGLVKGLFGGGEKYTPPKPVPTIGHEAVQAAGDAERMRQRRAGGRASTMLTGGVGDTSSASIGTTTLLGR